MKELIMAQERIIDTGLTGPIQKDILASIMGQLSDGYWENSPRMEQYWRNADVQERDGKVVLVIRRYAFPYYAMSDDQIKQWFAKKIKFIIKEEFGKGRNVWSRTNTKQKTDYLSHKCPSQTSVSDCYQAYDILMGRRTDNKKYSMESTFKKLTGKKVIKETVNTVEDAISIWTIDVDLVENGKRGYIEEKLRKFAEFFLPICPEWCSYCESADLNEYEEDSAPKYVPMINIDQIIFIMLLPNGTTVRVEDSYAPVTDFRNWEKAKKYIIEQLKDEGVEVTTESVDEFDEYTPFIPSDDQIRKEAMSQLRYEDIPYSEAKMLANDIVAALCGQPFDNKSDFEQYVSFEIKENLRAFWESKKVDKSKKVVTEMTERIYNQFHEAFENWKPSNCATAGDYFLDEGYRPTYNWGKGMIKVSLLENGTILVHSNTFYDDLTDSFGFEREFEIDEIAMAKECIEGMIEQTDLAIESKKPSRKAVIKQGAMKEIYTKFVEEFAYWEPRNQTSRGDLTEDMEGNPCVAFEDGRVVISLLEFGKKIKVCADQSQDYMRKYFNFDEVEAIKKYTESLIDYIHSDANNLEDQNIEEQSVIKQSIDERKTKQMISQAVDRLDLPNWANKDYIKQDIWDAIINDDFDYAYDSVDDLELLIYDYLKTEGMFNQSVKPSMKKKVIKEESEFDNISWSPDAPAPTLDQVIAKLQKAREELGNVEVAVQYRDDGGEYSGYDNNLYFWFDKKTNTFVL